MIQVAFTAHLETETVKPINDFVFTILGFERLVFSNVRENIHSRKLKKKQEQDF